MKVFAFQVRCLQDTGPLEEALERAAAMTLDERLQSVNRQWIRMDSVELHDGLWLMNFERIRLDRGPGRGSLREPTEGFDLEDHQGFSEEAAALYDPRLGYLLFESNRSLHYRTVAAYLARFVEEGGHGYELRPKFDESAEARLDRKAFHRRVEMTIATRYFSQADHDENTAIGYALRAGTTAGADEVTVILKIERSNPGGLVPRVVRDAIQRLTRLHEDETAAVKKLSVAGKDGPDARMEAIDLLTPRLNIEFNDVLPGVDRRVPLDVRWHALQRARAGWQQLLG